MTRLKMHERDILLAMYVIVESFKEGECHHLLISMFYTLNEKPARPNLEDFCTVAPSWTSPVSCKNSIRGMQQKKQDREETKRTESDIDRFDRSLPPRFAFCCNPLSPPGLILRAGSGNFY